MRTAFRVAACAAVLSHLPNALAQSDSPREIKLGTSNLTITPEKIDPIARARIDKQLSNQVQEWTRSVKVLTGVSELVQSKEPVIASEAETFKKSIENAVAAKKWINGEFVPPGKMKAVEEAVQRANHPVWVLCNGTTWFSPTASSYFVEILQGISDLKNIAAATGMIVAYDLPEKTRRGSHVGTAIVIGPNRVLTNRHVIEKGYIAYKRPDTLEWKMISSIGAQISFPNEYENCTSKKTPRTVSVIGIEAVHPTLDMAILITDGTLPAPVNFPQKTDLIAGDRIAVIGYPSRPQDGETFLTPKQVDDVFRSPDNNTPFAVERIASGSTLFKNPEADYFAYDATTWRGNSGSIVINLRTGLTVGLHARGLQDNVEGGGYNEGVLADQVSAFLKSTSQIQSPSK